MSTDTAIMMTAITREGQKGFTVQSPLAHLVAFGKTRKSALSKFVELVSVYLRLQQREEAQGLRGRGRPSKHYDKNIHIQVQQGTKDRFDAIAKSFELSQGETLVFLLDTYEIVKEDFAAPEEIKDAELSVLQPATAGK
jgi:hypothetical protein